MPKIKKKKKIEQCTKLFIYRDLKNEAWKCENNIFWHEVFVFLGMLLMEVHYLLPVTEELFASKSYSVVIDMH